MGIDRLNKAAIAAGYAMATPEDDQDVETKAAALVGEDAGRGVVRSKALALTQAPQWRSLHAAKDWMRAMVPSFGGRAPA